MLFRKIPNERQKVYSWKILLIVFLPGILTSSTCRKTPSVLHPVFHCFPHFPLFSTHFPLWNFSILLPVSPCHPAAYSLPPPSSSCPFPSFSSTCVFPSPAFLSRP